MKAVILFMKTVSCLGFLLNFITFRLILSTILSIFFRFMCSLTTLQIFGNRCAKRLMGLRVVITVYHTNIIIINSKVCECSFTQFYIKFRTKKAYRQNLKHKPIFIPK